MYRLLSKAAAKLTEVAVEIGNYGEDGSKSDWNLKGHDSEEDDI